jgi:dienelactone hydrolase
MRLQAILTGLAVAMIGTLVIAADSKSAKPTAAPAGARPEATTTQPAGRFGKMPKDPTPGDQLLNCYFFDRTRAITAESLAETKAEWSTKKSEYRRELLEMLGLWPLPERTDLKPVITGKIDNPEFTVEKLRMQSMPGLYVTANVYVPKNLKGKAPAILYVCGHGNVVKNGVSYGAKAAYQHWGAWFARNGYVCLVLDTLQLGEIQGIHHGLYREKMWWWISRGYTPAGVEAWNAMRCLDYLETRPEVDSKKFGITGRSGGGAYSWWTAAIDERIACAVPVAGITDIQNYVYDGCIEGHCDCMFMVNQYRWDFPKVAALVSPRPLLISNSDKDDLFPLEGLERLHQQVRRIYRWENADDKLGLLMTEGPHKDTQELQVPAMRWFNRWLKNDTGPLKNFAEKMFEPEQLKVFDKLPADQINTKIQESFVPKAPAPQVPADAAAWSKQRDECLKGLKEKTFAAWPQKIATWAGGTRLEEDTDFSVERNGIRFRGVHILSQSHVPITVYIAQSATVEKPDLVVLNILDNEKWKSELSTYKSDFAKELKFESLPDANKDEAESTYKMLKGTKWAMAYVAVRGVGQTAWSGDEKRQTHIRRRFWLLGESLDGMRVWDVRAAIQTVRQLAPLKDSQIWLQGEGRFAGIALYASLFEPNITRLDLWNLAATHDLSQAGPDLLNVLKVMDIPQAVAMAAEHSKVRIYRPANQPKETWSYPIEVAKKLGWGDDRVQLRDAEK